MIRISISSTSRGKYDQKESLSNNCGETVQAARSRKELARKGNKTVSAQISRVSRNMRSGNKDVSLLSATIISSFSSDLTENAL
jgi:hypothetical protein